MVQLLIGVRETAAIVMPHLLGILELFFVSTLLMWVLRLLVRVVYEYVSQDNDTTGAFVYGVEPSAVAVAKSLQSSEEIYYILAGFVSPYNGNSRRLM